MWKGFYFKENRFVAVKKIRVFEKVRPRGGRGEARVAMGRLKGLLPQGEPLGCGEEGGLRRCAKGSVVQQGGGEAGRGAGQGRG